MLPPGQLQGPILLLQGLFLSTPVRPLPPVRTPWGRQTPAAEAALPAEQRALEAAATKLRARCRQTDPGAERGQAAAGRRLAQLRTRPGPAAEADHLVLSEERLPLRSEQRAGRRQVPRHRGPADGRS